MTTQVKAADKKASASKNLQEWITCCGVRLLRKHKNILTSQLAWLDDQLINAMLKQQHPQMNGLQSPVLADNYTMSPSPNGDLVQVIQVNNDHWLALSTVGCQPSEIRVFDSLGGRLPQNRMKLVADLLQSKEKELTIEYVHVQRQRGGSDCGLFALAFITSVCNGEDPAKHLYDQAAMRKHLVQCIEKGRMSPFPSSARRKSGKSTTTIPVYCVCRTIDDGTKMIECAGCKEWYHLACVEVEKIFVANKKLDWFCHTCT